jgi:hypothetical protein
MFSSQSQWGCHRDYSNLLSEVGFTLFLEFALLLNFEHSIGLFSCQASPLDMFPWQATLGCYSSYVASRTIVVIPSESGSTSTETDMVGTTDGINAYAIRVRFQASDFAATFAPTSSVSPTLSAVRIIAT